MGGIVGSGIFMNPSVVARHVRSGLLVMLVWIAGGAIALLGAGIFAELAARRPHDGGLYAYHARRISSRARVHVRVGAAARFAERRHGGRRGNVCGVLRAPHRLADFNRGGRRRRDRAFHRVNALGVRTGTSTQNASWSSRSSRSAASSRWGYRAFTQPAVATRLPRCGRPLRGAWGSPGAGAICL